MVEEEYASFIYETRKNYIEFARKELQHRWNKWPKTLKDYEIYEAIGGLLARQVTLATQTAVSPGIWNGHIAPIIHRTMADVYIKLSWLLQEPLERSRKYILYGLGQNKLEIEHRKSKLDKYNPDPTEKKIIGSLETWGNSQRYTFLTDVDLGSWSGISTRKMAEEVDCLDFYNFVYQTFSAASHSTWNHVGRYNVKYCHNPLHKFHKVPNDPDIGSDIFNFYLSAKYLEKSFNLFDDSLEIDSEVESAFNYLNSRLKELESNDEREKGEENHRKEIIEKYNNVIIDIYKEHDMRCLRGLYWECKIDGKNIYPWYRKATHYFAERNKDFNFYKNLDDLILISDEIMYFTANVILNEKFMNDPSKNKIIIDGSSVLFRNFINLYSKRFDSFTDVCYEKIYNYWDRIGDLIAACIETGLNERNIYFTTVIDSIPKEYENNKNSKWLKSYRLNGFKILNEKRRNIVHYSSTGTDSRDECMKSATDEEKIKEFMEERRDLPNFFKKAIDDTIKGFQNTLDFLIYAQKIEENS